MLLWTKTVYSSTAGKTLRIIHLPARMKRRAAERMHLRERDIDLRKQIAGWRVRRRCSRSAANSIVWMNIAEAGRDAGKGGKFGEAGRRKRWEGTQYAKRTESSAASVPAPRIPCRRRYPTETAADRTGTKKQPAGCQSAVFQI